MDIRIETLESVESTNSYLSARAAKIDYPLMVVAREQTAGRGQRGNSWESEPGKNLTFSILVRLSDFPARKQFAISEAVALAIRDALAGFGLEAKVKWPNDIYVGDRKICGILIEHAIMGANLMHTIIGAGINVNQRVFRSPAPNPVSMSQILNRDVPLDELRDSVASKIGEALGNLSGESFRRSVHSEFCGSLWRGDGECHRFRDTASGECFDAAIASVDPEGPITLRRDDGKESTYFFKQVEFIL